MTPWAGTPAQRDQSVFGRLHGGGRMERLDTPANWCLPRAAWTGPPNDPGTGPSDFYSPHANGIHFLFADGSVSLVKSTVNLKVYRALCTREGGELIDANSY